MSAESPTDDAPTGLAKLPSPWLAFRSSEQAKGREPADKRSTFSELTIKQMFQKTRQYFDFATDATSTSSASPNVALGSPFGRSSSRPNLDAPLDTAFGTVLRFGLPSPSLSPALPCNPSPLSATSSAEMLPSLVPRSPSLTLTEAARRTSDRVAQSAYLLRHFVMIDKASGLSDRISHSESSSRATSQATSPAMAQRSKLATPPERTELPILKAYEQPTATQAQTMKTSVALSKRLNALVDAASSPTRRSFARSTFLAPPAAFAGAEPKPVENVVTTIPPIPPIQIDDSPSGQIPDSRSSSNSIGVEVDPGFEREARDQFESEQSWSFSQSAQVVSQSVSADQFDDDDDKRLPNIAPYMSPIDRLTRAQHFLVTGSILSTPADEESMRARVVHQRLASDIALLTIVTSIPANTLHRLHRAFCAAVTTNQPSVGATSPSRSPMADPIPVMVFVEFARALSFSESSVLAKRIFDIFDIHHVRALNFAQFAVGVSVLSNNCKSVSLARFTFDVYDTKKDDCIDFDELRAMLENSLADRGATYTPEGIASVCRNTMMLLDPEQRGYISFSRYEQLMRRNPSTLKPFEVTIEKILERFGA